jgi:hypothetical protein
LNYKQACAEALQGEWESARVALATLARRGDPRAAASLAQITAVLGDWSATIRYASQALLDKSEIAYPAFSDTLQILATSARKTGRWSSLKRVCDSLLPRAKKSRGLREHLNTLIAVAMKANNRGAKTYLDPEPTTPLSGSMARGFNEAVRGLRSDIREGRKNPIRLQRELFDTAKECGSDKVMIDAFTRYPDALDLDRTLDAIRAVVRQRQVTRAWNEFCSRLSSWRRPTELHLLPTLLITDPYLSKMLTLSRAKTLLSTPRSHELEVREPRFDLSRLEKLIAPAKVLRLTRGSPRSPFDTHFGGSPYSEARDTWPRCSSCDAPLGFVGQLHLEDPLGLVEFFYCVDCGLWGDEDIPSALIRRYPKPSQRKFLPLKNPRTPSRDDPRPAKAAASEVRSFPSLEELPARVRNGLDWDSHHDLLKELGAVSAPKTQIGGHPYWIQSAQVPRCPTCSRRCIFAAQIASENTANLMWGDAGAVYLFVCPTHHDRWRLVLQCY